MARRKLRNIRARHEAAFGADGAVTAGAIALQTAAQVAQMIQSRNATIQNAQLQANAQTRAATTQANALAKQNTIATQNAEKQIETQKEAQAENKDIQNNYYLALQTLMGQQNQNDRLEASKIQVRNGGDAGSKNKIPVSYLQGGLQGNMPFKVTDGGGVIPVGVTPEGFNLYEIIGNDHNHYHKTKSGKHKTGVGFKFANGSVIEGEGNQRSGQGEYLMTTPNDAVFISKHSINGFNPAQAVNNGMNPLQAFQLQEYIKAANGISDDGKHDTKPPFKKNIAMTGTSLNPLLYNVDLGMPTTLVGANAFRQSLRNGGRAKASFGDWIKEQVNGIRDAYNRGTNPNNSTYANITGGLANVINETVDYGINKIIRDNALARYINNSVYGDYVNNFVNSIAAADQKFNDSFKVNPSEDKLVNNFTDWITSNADINNTVRLGLAAMGIIPSPKNIAKFGELGLGVKASKVARGDKYFNLAKMPVLDDNTVVDVANGTKYRGRLIPFNEFAKDMNNIPYSATAIDGEKTVYDLQNQINSWLNINKEPIHQISLNNVKPVIAYPNKPFNPIDFRQTLKDIYENKLITMPRNNAEVLNFNNYFDYILYNNGRVPITDAAGRGFVVNYADPLTFPGDKTPYVYVPKKGFKAKVVSGAKSVGNGIVNGFRNIKDKTLDLSTWKKWGIRGGIAGGGLLGFNLMSPYIGMISNNAGQRRGIDDKELVDSVLNTPTYIRKKQSRKKKFNGGADWWDFYNRDPITHENYVEQNPAISTQELGNIYAFGSKPQPKPASKQIISNNNSGAISSGTGKFNLNNPNLILAVGSLINGGLNIAGGFMNKSAQNSAGKLTANAYNQAGDLLANAYSQWHGVDLSKINKDDFSASIAMPGMVSYTDRSGQATTQINRQRDAVNRNLRRYSLSSASALDRQSQNNVTANDARNQVYNQEGQKQTEINKLNAANITQASIANAQNRTQANQNYYGILSDAMKFNADVDNQKVTGIAQSKADAITNAAGAIANARINGTNSLANALSATGQSIGNAFNAIGNNMANFQNVMAGSTVNAAVTTALSTKNKYLAQVLYNQLKNSTDPTYQSYAASLINAGLLNK